MSQIPRGVTTKKLKKKKKKKPWSGFGVLVGTTWSEWDEG